MNDDMTIEINGLFIRRRPTEHHANIAVVNFVSIDGSVNYRIKGTHRRYYSKRENFLKNWQPLDLHPPTTGKSEGGDG